MSDKLLIDWCSYGAAKYAVEHWHYSRRMPNSKLAKLGVWEDGDFIGAIIFGRGATDQLVNPYGLDKWQGAELVRIALKEHATPVTRLVSIALKMLSRQSPGLRLVVSFADPEQGHLGRIYQAGNWLYTGMTIPAAEYVYKGRRFHGRSLRLKFGKGAHKMPGVVTVMGSSKHRYLYPLDRSLKVTIEQSGIVLPYPRLSFNE